MLKLILNRITERRIAYGSQKFTNNESWFFIYRDSNNDVKVSVILINNDIWLTQNILNEARMIENGSETYEWKQN